MEGNSCHRQKGELKLLIPKEGLSVPTLQFKESLHLSASECGMASWQEVWLGARPREEKGQDASI